MKAIDTNLLRRFIVRMIVKEIAMKGIPPFLQTTIIHTTQKSSKLSSPAKSPSASPPPSDRESPREPGEVTDTEQDPKVVVNGPQGPSPKRTKGPEDNQGTFVRPDEDDHREHSPAPTDVELTDENVEERPIRNLPHCFLPKGFVPLAAFSMEQVHLTINNFPIVLRDLGNTPAELAALPAHESVARNPLLKLTRDGDPPKLPVQRLHAFTESQVERIVLTMDALLRNVKVEQAEAIRKNPSKYMIVVPFGGGTEMMTYRGDALKDRTEDFLNSLTDLKAPNMHLRLSIMQPENINVAKRSMYGNPLGFILEQASEDEVHFYKYQQVFAIDEGLTFVIHHIDPSAQDWHVANCYGSAVRKEDNVLERRDALVEIRTQLWYNVDFRRQVWDNLLHSGKVGSQDDLVSFYLASMQLKHIPGNSVEGQDVQPCFQLTAEPSSAMTDRNKKVAEIVRSQWYNVGVASLKAGSKFIGMDGWLGPKAADLPSSKQSAVGWSPARGDLFKNQPSPNARGGKRGGRGRFQGNARGRGKGKARA